MGTRHSEYRKDPLGWYVDHPDVATALFDRLDALGIGLEVLHDPCCGEGNIVDVALVRGIRATGADIVDRAAGRFGVRDFLQDTRRYENIVMNPPYDKRALEFIRHGLAHVLPGGKVIGTGAAEFPGIAGASFVVRSILRPRLHFLAASVDPAGCGTAAVWRGDTRERLAGLRLGDPRSTARAR